MAGTDRSKNVLKQLLSTLRFMVVKNIEQYCLAWISPQSGVTVLKNVVNNYEQSRKKNIAQDCCICWVTGCAFLSV